MDKGALERIQTQVTSTKIQAWEENEKAKAINKAQRRLADTEAWGEKKKASLEAKHKQIEIEAENLKHKKLEQLKNKEAVAQKTIQEEKAAIEAQREKSTMKVEDKASKYRASNSLPKKFFGFC